MALLTTIFQKLLSMALTALPVMAVVLLARLLLKKAPKKCNCILWLAVAFRLVCPVAPESAIGLIRPETAEEQVAAVLPAGAEQESGAGGEQPVSPWFFVQAEESGGIADHAIRETAPSDGTTELRSQPWFQRVSLTRAAALVWLTGLFAMLGWMFYSWLRLRRTVSAAVRRERDVWECDNIPTPFVMGLFRPHIYVPFHLDNNQRTYVMAHERCHIRRRDPWWKLLGCLILAVYWWDPAVWLCWALFCRDLEMSCDEAVLEQLGDQAKTGYSLSLVDFALGRPFPMALAFGEHDAARRVKNVLNWKRARPAVVCLCMALALLVVNVCVHDAKESGESRVTLGTGENGGAVFTVQAAENIRSWAIYEDVYQEGMLISSIHRIFDGFQDQGDGASLREFEGILRAEPSYHPDGGFEGTLKVDFQAVGGGFFDLTLPRDRYTGMGMLVGDGQQTTFRLEPEGEVTLYTILLSTKPEGAVTLSSQGGDLTKVNDTVVRYRLVLSGRPYTELENPPLDLAQTLYDLRVEGTADGKGVRALTDAIGADTLPPYSLVNYQSQKGERTWIVEFEEPLSDQQQTKAWEVCQLLLALVEDAGEVNYAFPVENGAEKHTYYCDRNQPDGWARSMGYKDMKEMGKSVQGVRDLLEYLKWDGAEVGDQAAALMNLAPDRDCWKLTEVLLPLDLWNDGIYQTVQVIAAANYDVTVLFDEPPEDPDALDVAMARRAMVLMRLKPEDLNQVCWSYPGENGTEHRMLHVNEAAGITGLSSDSRIYQPMETAVNLDRFIRFLKLDEKLFLHFAGEGNSLPDQPGNGRTEAFSEAFRRMQVEYCSHPVTADGVVLAQETNCNELGASCGQGPSTWTKNGRRWKP